MLYVANFIFPITDFHLENSIVQEVDKLFIVHCL